MHFGAVSAMRGPSTAAGPPSGSAVVETPGRGRPPSGAPAPRAAANWAQLLGPRKTGGGRTRGRPGRPLPVRRGRP
eukprot:9098703-Pyramimonas_sp.AAC.1